MPIVPTEPSLLDRFIELEDTIRRREAGCGLSTGGDPPELPAEPEPEAPPAPETTRAIVLPGSCKKKANGDLVFPNGNPWNFFPGTDAEPAAGNVLEALALRDGTEATPSRARLNVKLRWSPTAEAAPPSPRGTLLFKLPPGWWPVRKVTVGVRVVATSGAGAWGLGHIEIGDADGHVTFHPTRAGLTPWMIDLTPVVYDAGAGAGGQGDGSNDPTGGGCGAPWDGDPDNENTPELPGLEPGGGGGAPIGGWNDVHVFGDPWPSLHWRQDGDIVRFSGNIVNATDLGNTVPTHTEYEPAGDLVADGTFPQPAWLARMPSVAERGPGDGNLLPVWVYVSDAGSVEVLGDGDPVRWVACEGLSYQALDTS